MIFKVMELILFGNSFTVIILKNEIFFADNIDMRFPKQTSYCPGN